MELILESSDLLIFGCFLAVWGWGVRESCRGELRRGHVGEPGVRRLVFPPGVHVERREGKSEIMINTRGLLG